MRLAASSALIATLTAAAPAALAPDAPDGWVTSVRDRYPSLSPDGKTLLFESDRTGAPGLYLAAPDGSGVRPLVLGEGGPSNAAWSPDGSRIAYHETVGAEFDIFVINADGTGRRNLTNTAFEEAHPHWSADGRRIYFNSDRATADHALPWGARDHDLFSMDPEGGDVRRITSCRAVCTNPNPSPDGRHIAFRMGLRAAGLSWAQRPSTMNSEIALLDLSSGAIVNLTRHPAYDTWPSWSPDSQWIAFGSNRDGVANVGQLFMVRKDGSTTRRLTGGPASHGEPSFAPDGRSILFSRSAAGSARQPSLIASMTLDQE